MSINFFALGAQETFDKIAASSNPAQPQKSSKDGMERDEGPRAPYMNGGGGAGKHVAGEVASKPQPWPGHVNIGDKSPGTHKGGDVEGRGGSPDTGELGTAGDSNKTVTKSASYELGAFAMFDVLADNDDA